SCDSKDIDPSEGIILSDDGKTGYLHGEHLTVRCGEGLTPSNSKARCSRGEWVIREKLCVESSCNVVKIDRGAFTQQVQKSEWTMFSGTKRWIEYEKVTLGSTKSPGSSLYVSCNEGYTFQGKGSNDVEVKCRSGKFCPNPVCLITGVPYEDEEDSKRDVSSFVNQGSDKRNPPENKAVDRATSVVHEENSNRQPDVDDAVPPPACTCTYRGLDDDVIAYYGTDILEYGQKVKKNEKVKFQCRDFGYYRLNGKKEITCEDCRPWHSAEYPDCVVPTTG
ncbi:protein lev-9, partial [Caerostris darwini]